MGSSGPDYRAPVEAPNTLQSMQEVTIVEAISEGPIVGLYTGDERSIALNDNPLKTEAGALTYQNVGWSIRTGLPDQEPFADVAGTESEVSVGVEVTKYFPRASGSGSGAVTRTISNPNCTHVRVTLSVQGLYKQIVDDADHTGYTVGETVEYSVTIIDAADKVIISDSQKRTDKTMSSAQWTMKYALSGTAPWRVSVTKNHADNEKADIKNDLYWSSYTEIIARKMIYPHTAVMMIRGSAETFGSSIPTRAYRVKGLIVEVPSNYDPATRVYTGIWNGTFKNAWTDNPAWILRDIIENDRYGLKKVFPPRWTNPLMDKWTLYEIAKICDEGVNDGYGGTEPRYTFNGQIMGSGDAKEVVQSIASVFHGMTYWGSALMFAVCDYPTDPLRTLNQTTINSGTLSYSTGSAQEIHSVALVTWYDPDNYGKATIETVVDWDKYQRYGYREVKVTAYGCYSRGQAYRHGLWTLLTEDEQWQCTLEQGLEGYDLMPGTVVKIADPTIMGTRYSGRVLSIDGKQITLDAAVVLVDGESYKLYIVADDGTEEELTITSRGESNIVTVSKGLAKGFTDYPAWSISGTDAAPREFSVRTLKEKSDGTVEVSLREVNANKYLKIESNLTLKRPPVSKPSKGNVTPPSGLVVMANTYIENGTPSQRLTFSWAATGDPDAAEYEAGYQSPSGAWMNFTPQRVFSIDVPAALPGVWTFRVRACAIDGRLSDWAEKSYTLSGIATTPTAPTNLQAVPGHRSVTIKWTAANDALVGHYEVYMSSDEYLDNAVLVGKIYGSSFTVMDLGILDTKWFWVRSVSYADAGVSSDMVGPVFATTKALEMEDIPDQSIEPGKFIPQLERVIADVQKLSVAGVVSAIVTDKNRDKAATATQELNTKVVEGFQAEATARTELAARINENTAALVEEQTARAEADRAEATARETLAVQMSQNIAAAIQTEAEARAAADRAEASQRETLATQVGGNTAAIQTNAIAIATVDGKVEATYSVVVDANGRIAGIMLGSNGQTSEMVVLADKFKIAKADGSATQIFTVDTVTGFVQIVGSLIASGSITGDKIFSKTKIQIGDSIILDGANEVIQIGTNIVLNGKDGSFF